MSGGSWLSILSRSGGGRRGVFEEVRIPVKRSDDCSPGDYRGHGARRKLRDRSKTAARQRRLKIKACRGVSFRRAPAPIGVVVHRARKLEGRCRRGGVSGRSRLSVLTRRRGAAEAGAEFLRRSEIPVKESADRSPGDYRGHGGRRKRRNQSKTTATVPTENKRLVGEFPESTRADWRRRSYSGETWGWSRKRRGERKVEAVNFNAEARKARSFLERVRFR